MSIGYRLFGLPKYTDTNLVFGVSDRKSWYLVGIVPCSFKFHDDFNGKSRYFIDICQNILVSSDVRIFWPTPVGIGLVLV